MMKPFGVETGVAAVLTRDNVDTDQIIPSREIRAVSRRGLADGLFAGWRYLDADARTPNPDFVLNQPAYAGARMIIAGANFGCGSSREQAAWALAEYGVRAIVAESFGAIFRANCVRNAIAPITLYRADVAALASQVAQDPQAHQLVVDLPAQTIAVTDSDFAVEFPFAPYDKRLLVEGLDPIGLTLTQHTDIEAFLAADAQCRPWLYSAGGT